MRGMHRGGVVTEPEWVFHLPPGYRLDRSDPDVWALRRPLQIIVFDLAAFRGARVAVGWTHAEFSWAPGMAFSAARQRI
jgi:hypothetical protein